MSDPALTLTQPSVFAQYKTKISDEMDLKKRIQSLEESMELHERMKRQALAEFESYRQRMEDMQLCTEAQVCACACACRSHQRLHTSSSVHLL